MHGHIDHSEFAAQARRWSRRCAFVAPDFNSSNPEEQIAANKAAEDAVIRRELDKGDWISRGILYEILHAVKRASDVRWMATYRRRRVERAFAKRIPDMAEKWMTSQERRRGKTHGNFRKWLIGRAECVIRNYFIQRAEAPDTASVTRFMQFDFERSPQTENIRKYWEWWDRKKKAKKEKTDE